MVAIILRLIDRCIFACLFIIGVQAPEFIQQYMQRLSGHADESKFQLQQFQQIADINFNGELSELIQHYLANTDSAIRQTGNFISNLFERNQSFEYQLQQLQQSEYIDRLVYFAQHVDMEIAQATLSQYQLAIPLETHALVTGFAFAFGTFLFIALVFNILKLVWKSLFSNKGNYSTLQN